MDPIKISKKLRLNPTCSWLSGSQRKTPKGRQLGGVNDFSYCLFTLERTENEMIESLRSFLNKLEEHKRFLAFVSKSGGRSEIYLSLFVTKNSGDVFDWSMLAKFGELHISLALDVYPSIK
jgi:hypothetical protein